MQATIDTMFVNEKDSFCQFSQDKCICGKNQSLPPPDPLKYTTVGGGSTKRCILMEKMLYFTFLRIINYFIKYFPD